MKCIETIQLVMLTNNFAFVGLVRRKHDGIVIRRAWHVAEWGTGNARNLLDGPLPDTQLVSCSRVRIPGKLVAWTMDFDAVSWMEIIHGKRLKKRLNR